ncbi:MAG: T9SS type A sorting domain-containing protein [Flavobacteriales bacterium]|nr:T9SS type A sorting domain-containing protein [Flavobacteriales bacterium]MCX7649101.1 T9SS type A sorting domain-containing protein [Flavobacteriales bacterium]MDW8431996.1 T9SS type A sorting domain-containing protein [Flavobacteriales bacterium]
MRIQTFTLLLVVLLNCGMAHAGGDPVRRPIAVAFLKPFSSETDFLNCVSNLTITDQEGVVLPFVAHYSGDYRKPSWLEILSGDRPLKPSDIVIHGSLAPPTHVTVADISGFTEDMMGTPLGLDPSFSTSPNHHQNSSHLVFPEGNSPMEQPKASQAQVFPNPTDGNFQVVTEGDVPFVRAYLADAQGRILEQWGVPSIRAFFSLRHLPAGLYYLVVETAVWRERHTIFKY